MRRTTLLTLTSLLCCLIMQAQGSIGSWRSHVAYHNATQCVATNGKVYVLSDGSLYSYSPADEFVETYDKVNSLSDQGIRHIAADEQSGTLVIIYNNANIDLLRHDGTVENITDYANKTTLDPMVNDVRIANGNAYLSTNFGLTVLNIARGEFINTYTLGRVTHSSIETNGNIYAATANGLYRGNTKDNLLDTCNWIQINTSVYTQLAYFKGQLMALKTKKSIDCIDPTNGNAEIFLNKAFNFMHYTENDLFIGNNKETYVYHSLTDYQKLALEGVTYLTSDGTTYWSTHGVKGLNGYTYDKTNKSISHEVGPIIPNSPIRNHCQYMNFVSDERLLIAGGCLNYFGTTFFDGTLMMYEAGEWKTFQEEGIATATGVHYKNMTSIVQDPKDETHHYASSFGQGIYEFKDMKLVNHITDKNSFLESAVPGSNQYTRISRLIYDKWGNLWITNGRAEAPLKIMKPDGTMANLYYKELEGLPTVTEVLFDKQGRVWVVSMRGEDSVRLFCIDMNGTLENTADDRIKVFDEKFIDQDNLSVEIYYINDIAEDLNGDIWVMTDKGPYVMYDTDKVFDNNYHFTKIKVPRNDGTNYADYLLDGVYTTCVEIDAANRKWIGTLSNGLYLVESDGLETLHHFTAENSPLLSNTIESLAIHHASGELYIGTDKGIVSYMGDAIRAEEEYHEENVYAYPNPISPDYTGLITIVGLKTNSNVKIINAAGRLIAEGRSLGGSFTWDGKNPQGQRVATGIYYVLGADEKGDEGIVTKILFIQ